MTLVSSKKFGRLLIVDSGFLKFRRSQSLRVSSVARVAMTGRVRAIAIEVMVAPCM